MNLLGSCLILWTMSVLEFKTSMLACLRARSTVCLIINEKYHRFASATTLRNFEAGLKSG